MGRNDGFHRRTVLRGTAGVLAAGVLAGCSGVGGSGESGGNGGSGGNRTTSGSGGGTGTETGTETNNSTDTGTTASTGTAGNSSTDSGTSGASAQVGQWLAGTNYDGSIADVTGTDSIEIAVGAGENGFAFDPAAVRVSSGTTVRWMWTGRGGAHNVVAKDGAFDSGEIQAGSDVTYETTLDQSGTHLYYCEPHRRLGMKGAVVVSG